jgi:hypothetical protein
MDAQRFFSVAFDVRNHPKLVELGIRQGNRMEALGRWVALLGILYDRHGVLSLGTEFAQNGEVTPKVEMLMRELDFADGSGLAAFIADLAECDLVDGRLWRELGDVASEGVAEQIAYLKRKSDAGKMGGRPRKSIPKSRPKST